MAKKAVAAPKKAGKASASKPVAKAAAAKPAASKVPAKVAAKAVPVPAPKKVAPPPPTKEVVKETPKKAVEKASAKAAEKAPVKAQTAETSEKIKVDKNMSEEQAKWVEMYNKNKDAQISNYDMKSSFKALSPIQHKVLGWGWIVSNENDRLEVLFKDGKRMLISNYKG